MQELKEKDKKTGKISFKKEELVRILVFLRFTFLYILHISKRQPAKRLPDFYKKNQKYIEIQEEKTLKHFELGQMHKVEINEEFKEIKTAPERSSRSMSQEMEEQRQREAERKRKEHEKDSKLLDREDSIEEDKDDYDIGDDYKIGSEMDDLDKNDLIRDDEEPDLEEEEYKIGDEFDDLDRDDEILDDDFDYDESEDLDNWLDEEDIGNDFMLRQQYINQNRADNLDHGFGGRDDDGFRGLDSEDGFGGPSASGFDFDDYDMDMEIE